MILEKNNSMNNCRKKITYPLELKKLSLENEGEFCGYASVFNTTDLHNDIVMKGAFRNVIKSQQKTPLLWQHESKKPIGVITYMKEDDYGLFVKGTFLLQVNKAREAFALVKNGSITGLSIGYMPKKVIKKENTRQITDLDLLEISLVTFPANNLAKITEVKNINEIYKTNEMIRTLANNIRNLITK